jgi:hypothetical protein
LLGVGFLAAGWLSGCDHCDCGCGCGCKNKPWHIDNCACIPCGALPAPLGAHLHAFQQIQVSKAEVDDFVIYLHEWYMLGTDLGPYGRYHLNQIVKRLPDVPFAVEIQPQSDSAINEERRQIVVSYLTSNGIPDADQRVIIAFPQAEGISGAEAEGMGGRGQFSPRVVPNAPIGPVAPVGIGFPGLGGARF